METKKKRANSVLKPSTSLIPIKGISSKMQAKLAEHKILDIPSLLYNCNTQQKRDNLAKELGIATEHINSWVKQGDLWKIDGITTDMAFMLVQIGVRGVDDLSKIDSDKAYPILKSIALTNPDFLLCTKSELEKLIQEAANIVQSSLDLIELKNNISQIIDLQKNNTDISSIYDILGKIKSESNPYGFNEDEPDYLFKNPEKETSENWANKLSAAWKDLFELDCILPLPKTISGTVKEKSMNTKDKPIPFEGVKVEIEGIVSPAEDKTEAVENPSCITDSTGRFIITLPDRYSFKETVKIIISNSRGKQEFVKSSTEIINALEETDIVYALQNILSKRIAYREACANNSVDKDNLKNEFESAVNVLTDKDSKYKSKVDSLGISDAIKSLKTISVDTDDNAFDKLLKEIFDIILLKATLEAKIEGINITSDDDSFIVIKEIFTGNNIGLQKSLPSVKLMGDDENPVMLSTDSAPTRMYSYSMLQRLIEPKLKYKKSTSGTKEYSEKTRVSVDEPIDIDAFKSDIYENIDAYPQMASLGLGYQLNMHQAWVPDGFALGDLLYSLILAPGEEQRLIVRENKQTYQITDTAQGTDHVTEDYQNNQTDDTSAVYDYAVSQMMDANSSYKSSVSGWNIGGSASGGYGGFFSLGLTGGYSSSSSKGSANASQHNSHNEASSAAQQFQQKIKTSSNRLAQAERLSVSIASSDVSDSVATKIIANHNHSHAMTIQYWEVMRRYRLETAIDSVDLVLFVPLKLINFLGNGTDAHECKLIYDFNGFDKNKFANRYDKLIKHANTLEGALPWKYRTGLDLIRKYAATPTWTVEPKENVQRTLTLNFTGNYLTVDLLSATIYFKNGKGTAHGELTYNKERKSIVDLLGESGATTRDELKSVIRNYRNTSGDVEVQVTFTLPGNVVEEDISSIQISHSFDTLNYTLNQVKLNEIQKIAYEEYLEKYEDLAHDNKNSSGDRIDINHYMSLLPESYTNREVKFKANTLRTLGNPTIHSVNISMSDNSDTLSYSMSSTKINNKTTIYLSSSVKTLRSSDIEQMEKTLHHITTDSMRYSQVIWSSLSSDERAMIFDKYTIDMDFSQLRKFGSSSTFESVNVPLLNCVNIRKMLGFYGNCMLFPFTFPKELADVLGRSALEVQDQLYRYHTNSFRAPTTIISMPTKGMIGEAVLGQTNVSELIDLTRFWNWQDSPIDKMEITNDYLNNTDYLKDKKTKDITPLGLQSTTATQAATATNLLASLVGKQTPSFTNLTGLEQLASLVKSNTESAAAGRESVVNKSSEMVNKNMEIIQKMDLAQKIQELENKKITNGLTEALSPNPFAALSNNSAAGGASGGAGNSAAGGKNQSANSGGGKNQPADAGSQAPAGDRSKAPAGDRPQAPDNNN